MYTTGPLMSGLSLLLVMSILSLFTGMAFSFQVTHKQLGMSLFQQIMDILLLVEAII